MEIPRTKITWKTVLFPVFGIVAFFLYIYLFQVDIIGIIKTLQTINPLPYALAAALSILEILFFSISWRVLANFLYIKLSVLRSYLFVWYGIFVDTIVPAESVSGELVRVYLITKEQGNSKCGPAMASLVTHRFLGMGMNVAVLLIGIVLLVTGGQTQLSGLVFNSILLVAIAISASLIALIVLSFKEKWTAKLVEWVIKAAKFVSRGRWNLNQLKESAHQITQGFHLSMKEFKNKPKPVIVSLFYLIITWIFSLSIQYLVFMSLGISVSWSMITITAAIVLAVKSIPVGIPFEVGIPEATMTTLYMAFNIDPATAATATILSRLLTLWLRFFIGFVAQQWLTLKPIINSTSNKPEITCKA
ncbi:MAG: lysylphosphatidylglycerol synthase transmembrane domain-containing protein [Candidatus Bathyarchaeia archaeon]|jgi:uncharacterized protein (TIRG00374 family)